MAFALLAPKLTTVSGEEGCDGGCTIIAAVTVAGSLACPAEPGSLFGMEFSPSGVRRADLRGGQDGQMWGSRGERKEGCSKTWRKLCRVGVQCLGSGTQMRSAQLGWQRGCVF